MAFISSYKHRGHYVYDQEGRRLNERGLAEAQVLHTIQNKRHAFLLIQMSAIAKDLALKSRRTRSMT